MELFSYLVTTVYIYICICICIRMCVRMRMRMRMCMCMCIPINLLISLEICMYQLSKHVYTGVQVEHNNDTPFYSISVIDTAFDDLIHLFSLLRFCLISLG